MFRLFDFNILDKFQDISGEEGEEEEVASRYKNDTFVIQMFGINEHGETSSIFVDDYKPFFYVLVNDDWTKAKKDEIKKVRDDLKEYCALDTEAMIQVMEKLKEKVK